MNKKLFTLAAALMMGSAFTVNAQDVITAGNTTKLSTSTYYYIGAGNGKFVKGTAVADKFTTLGEVPADEIDVDDNKIVDANEAYLWKISYQEVNGELLISLTNKLTGKLLGFDSNGSVTSTAANVKTTLFKWSALTTDDDGNLIYQFASQPIVVKAESKKIVWVDASDGTDEETGAPIHNNAKWNTSGTGTALNLYAESAKTIKNVDVLNSQLGNGFSFNFVGLTTQPSNNIFGQKLFAFDLTSGINNDWGTNYATGVYFALTPMPEDVKDDAADMKNWFLTTQFVAVSPVEHLGIPSLEQSAGKGFKLVTVLGKDLKQGAGTKNAVASANAAFKVYNPSPVSEPGNFTLSVSPYVKLKTSDANPTRQLNQYITISKVMGENYVTTSDISGAAKVKLGDVNMVAVKDLLKKDGPAVFNILFLSGADQTAKNPKEYGKYLGIMEDEVWNEGADDEFTINMLAQGPSFVNLESAELQWVISGADADNKTFTFMNRENGAKFTTTLRQTDKANVYEISSAEKFYVGSMVNGSYDRTDDFFNLSGKTIELKPVTVDKTAGFIDYADEELNQLVKLQFEVGSSVLSKDIYVTGTEYLNLDGTLNRIVPKTSQDIEDAAQWELIKRTGVSDTIYTEMAYAYLDKDGKVQDDKEFDNHEIVTYSIKLYRDGKDYYFNGAYDNLKQADKLILAPRFAIKENADGTIGLVSVNEIDNSYTENSLGINKNNGDLAYESIYALPNKKSMLYFGTEEATPSLEAVSRHASFESVNGGFLGVGADGDAIVAATKDEAQELTFWLDTTDVEKYTPSFYISQGIKAETKADAAEVRNFLFNAKDSVSYYDAGTASTITDWNYLLNSGETKAIFKAGTLVNKDSLNTIVAGKEVGLNNTNGLRNFKFNIVLADADVADEYVIKSVANNNYVANINGKVALVNDPYTALVVKLGAGDATANEAIAAESGVQVIGGEGVVTVQGAAGKVITVANILGQTIANQVAVSDNVTIAVPAGIAVVSVDGDATKVVVK